MYALGIDLGTTYTAAAVWREQRDAGPGWAETVALGNRAAVVPSVVFAAGAPSGFLVGEAAERRGQVAPERLAREFKRRFGDQVGLLLGGEMVSAAELTRQLLAWVVETVTTRCGEPPARVCLTAPATWRDFRLEQLREVAAAAGLAPSQVTVVAEPAAAAIYYAGQRRLAPGTTVGVYDLGGGTFDATVLRKTADSFEIVGTPLGSDRVGGVDLDHALWQHVTAVLGEPLAALDREDAGVRAGLMALRRSVVEAKEALSADSTAVVPVVLPGLTREETLSRTTVEQVAAPFVEQTLDVFARAVELAGLAPADLDGVLLVGGASRMPLVSRMLADRFGIRVQADAHPKYAVCLGAAISAGAGGTSTSPARAPEPRIAPPAQPRPTTRAPEPWAAPPAARAPEPWAAPPAARAAEPGPVAPAARVSAPAARAPEPRNPEPAPPAPEPPTPPVATPVLDLAQIGLGGADDVPLRPAVSVARHATESASERLELTLGGDAAYSSAARTAALRALLVSMLGLAALAALIFLR